MENAYTKPTYTVTLRGMIEQFAQDGMDVCLLAEIVSVFIAAQIKVSPRLAPSLETLKPLIVRDAAGSSQPGAMAAIERFGLFPTSLNEEGEGLMRQAIAHVSDVQRADLERLIAATGYAPILAVASNP